MLNITDEKEYFESMREHTVEEKIVAKIIRKVKYRGVQSFTFLHDNERITLSEYILGYLPMNEEAIEASNHDDIDIESLSTIAEKLIIEYAPELEPRFLSL